MADSSVAFLLEKATAPLPQRPCVYQMITAVGSSLLSFQRVFSAANVCSTPFQPPSSPPATR